MSLPTPLSPTTGALIVHPTQSNAARARQAARPAAPRVGAPSETADVCPISLESASALGADAFYSVADSQRLYSATHLKAWLEKSGRERARSNEQPLYRSPITWRDMQLDAVRLGLPATPRPSVSPATVMHRVTMVTNFVVAGLNITSAVLQESKRREQLRLLEQLPNNPYVLASIARAEFIKWGSAALAANCMAIMLIAHLARRGRF